MYPSHPTEYPMNTRTLYLLLKPSAIPNLIDKPHVKIIEKKKKGNEKGDS